MSEWMDFYRGKRVLVVGGTGSIGSRLVERLLENGAEVRILSRGENPQQALYRKLERKFNRYPKLRMRIGDIRNRQTMSEAVEGMDIVFHAAAMKHVDYCESNPWEAVQTNIIGAENVREACWEEMVQAVVYVSTDKAADPAGVMGESKHLAERLFLESDMGNTRTVVTRFGNVLGSVGSVVWKFKEQIAAGKYLSVTDPEMLRFIMMPQEAAELVLWAGVAAGNKIIVTRQMAAASVDTMIRAIADGKDFQFIASGPRPGEKREEVLFSEAEVPHTTVLESAIGKVALIDMEAPQHSKDLSDFDIHKQCVGPERVREMLAQAGVLP